MKTVRFFHSKPKTFNLELRNENEILKTKKLNSIRITVCGIYEDGVWSIGVATCSVKDNFCKKTGRAIALGRAQQHPNFQLEVPNPEDEKEALICFYDKAKELETMISKINIINRF